MELFKERRVLTVSALTALVRGLLEENFDQVWVEGEISNLACPQSGHCYFTLKDAGAQLRCVMFRGAFRTLKFTPRDGMRVLTRGRLTLFEPRGEYQLVADYLEPQGIGGLQLAFIQLKEKLAKEGLFSALHKKEMPKLPRRIGIVTSPTGAAIRDILTVLSRRFANVELLISPVRVQGEGAAGEIAQAIDDLNRVGNIDVMIVGRGGGSLEDLWAFNEESVARAIYRSAIPVISAVGHEIDFTIADFVADLRAATPSAAAELVVRSKKELMAELEALCHRLDMYQLRRMERWRARVVSLSRAVTDPTRILGHLSQRVDSLDGRLARETGLMLEKHGERIVSLSARLSRQSPALTLQRSSERLGTLSLRMDHALMRSLTCAAESLRLASGTLNAVSPLATLSRGYSITRKLPERTVVRYSREIEAGDRLELSFAAGGALCRVESTLPVKQ
ncbi:MAG: exodeoxyribonuclease VII large subunit [Geobacteraceae bacterium GWC2_58_44]|nr:MAG: exodeoxyribonuclease VII large subunit [Geobacteraceae bacterium GWC2_58_44]HBG06823.1 exodeoxyribonuclease VII large subunit [Geobacter sp.]